MVVIGISADTIKQLKRHKCLFGYFDAQYATNGVLIQLHLITQFITYLDKVLIIL